MLRSLKIILVYAGSLKSVQASAQPKQPLQRKLDDYSYQCL